MHLLCPHCHGPIELVNLTPDEEIACPSCGSSFRLGFPSTRADSGQETLGRFQLLVVVGQGAFGTVYKAHDPQLDRTVAVKVPRRSNIGEGSQELERFVREARSVAQLRHPAIVAVHEVSTQDGTPYLVSDFVEGVTLADLLTGRRPGFREAAEIIAQVADALDHAHQQGVIHRDVKPSNVMIRPDGGPCVMDFGLAKRDAGEITVTIDGQVLGTPAYMSPEQARGEGHRVDGRSDVYSVGVMLYQLLTGELPFRGNVRMLMHQVLHDEPRSPRTLNDRIPRDLETVCLKAMAKEPGRRYATAGELAADLRRWLAGEPVRARPVGRLERGWRWCKRNPAVAALTASLALALVAGATVSTVLAVLADQRAKDATLAEGKATRAADAAARKEAEAVKAYKDLDAAADQLRTTVARSLLRPMALQGGPAMLPLQPPHEAEVKALWELASALDDGLRVRFVEVALSDPVSTRQLKYRAEHALHAAAGLVEDRKARLGHVLARRLRDESIPAGQKLDIAVIVGRLGGSDPGLAADAAMVLSRALVDADIQDFMELVEALSAVASRLGPGEAAEPAAVLARALGEPGRPGRAPWMAQGLSALAARLGPEGANAACAPPAVALSRAVGGGGEQELWELTDGLSKLAVHLGPEETGRAVEALARALGKPTFHSSLIIERLTGMAPRVSPGSARRAIESLAELMGKSDQPFDLSRMARAVSMLAGRLEPGEASAARRRAAAALARAIDRAKKPEGLGELADGLTEVAGRLGLKEAEAECAPAAEALVRAVRETTGASARGQMAAALSVVASRLAPRESAAACLRAAAALREAVRKTENPRDFPRLAEGLSRLAGHVPPEEAVEMLSEALSRSKDPRASWVLVRALSRVPGLGPGEAARTGRALVEALGRTRNPNELQYLAMGLEEVSGRMEWAAAAEVRARAAGELGRAVLDAVNQGELDDSLAKGFAILAKYLDPEAAGRVADALVRAVTTMERGNLYDHFACLKVLADGMDPKEAGRIGAALLGRMEQGRVPAYLLGMYAEALSELAARLPPQDAAGVCSRAAAVLRGSISSAPVGPPRQSVIHGLSAVAGHLSPDESVAASVYVANDMFEGSPPIGTNEQGLSLSLALTRDSLSGRLRRSQSVARILGIQADPIGRLASPVLGISALESVPPPLPDKTLVELLKHPLCVGEARKIVLEQLSRHYGRPFADQWEFVACVKEKKLDLDLTTPPQRPQMPAAGR